MRSLFLLAAVALVVTLAPELTSADTPANCSWPEIAGKWIFTESERLETRTENCDEQQVISGANKVYLQLDFPNVASDREGNVGTWTLIYNQGFEVILNYRKYFAFSLYKQKGSTVTSYCNATQPGWSHDVLGNNWACFRGRKVVSWEQEEQQLKSNELHSSVHSSAGHLVGVGKEHRIRPFLLESVALHENHLSEHAVRRINSQQSGWTARVYEGLQRKSTEELLRMAGGRKSRLAHRPTPKPVDQETRRKVASLPEEFDWRNVDGVNYVSPVRDQGSCGSCYIFSSMALLEARLRIATNNSERTVFSTQEVVDCSRYSQGCDGGFPYLIGGKYAQDYGVIEDACYPYTASEQKCKTASEVFSSAQCRKRTYAARYHYVGGYYGGCNEELMRLELVTRGPIAVGFNVYPDFMSYSGGVYSHDAVAHHQTMARLGFNPFELTNHAVLIVGYGVDRQSGQRYWIVKNSWSQNWGLNGYFLIRRGTDECGIESLAVAATPIP